MKDQTLSEMRKALREQKEKSEHDMFFLNKELARRTAENAKLKKERDNAYNSLELMTEQYATASDKLKAIVNRLESIADDEINEICEGEYYKMIDQNVTGMVQQVPRFIKAFINHIKEG